MAKFASAVLIVLCVGSYSPSTNIVAAPIATTPTVRSLPPRTVGVPSWVMKATRRVNFCEEGGDWHVGLGKKGWKYYGGLGWLVATWQEFRTSSDPINMAYATPEQQARAMWKFANRYGWPDQKFCRAY